MSKILIQVILSESCRGWEGNSTKLVPFDGTLKEYLVNDGVVSEEDCDDLGLTDQSLSFDSDGDESQVTYNVLSDEDKRKMVELLTN